MAIITVGSNFNVEEERRKKKEERREKKEERRKKKEERRKEKGLKEKILREKKGKNLPAVC